MVEEWSRTHDVEPASRRVRGVGPSLARRVRAELGSAREQTRVHRASLARTAVDAALWSGIERESGQMLRCLYVGQRLNDVHLRRLLFDESGHEILLGSSPAYGVRSAVRRHQASVDLVIVDVGWPYFRLLGGAFLIVPAWVKQSFSIRERWNDTLAPLTDDARRNLSRVRRYKLSARLVRSEASADRFDDEMYEPHVRRRFGDAAVVDERHVVRSMCRRFGLLELRENGVPLGGTVLRERAATLDTLWDGFRAELDSAHTSAAAGGLYYYSVLFAHEQGFERLDFGMSRGFLSDGVFRYKKKWGARLDSAPAPLRVCFKARRWTPAVSAFFAAHPMLRHDEKGYAARVLRARHRPLDLAALRRIVEEHTMPGVHRVEVYSASGFEPEAAHYALHVHGLELKDLRTSPHPERDYTAS